MLMEDADTLDRGVKGRAQGGSQFSDGVIEISLGDPKRVKFDPIELGGESTQGVVTSGLHLGDDVADNSPRSVASHNWTG